MRQIQRRTLPTLSGTLSPRMHHQTDLNDLGRAFLDALVAKLGYAGAAAVLLLLAAEVKALGVSQRAKQGNAGRERTTPRSSSLRMLR